MQTKPSKSLRTAINNQCKDCIFDPNVKGSWRQQITDCTSKSCALYAVRPQTKAQKAN